MRILITAGGTVAPIDDVRSITNASSGRFGATIAEEWLGRGATVWYIHSAAAELPLLRDARLDAARLREEPATLHRRLDAAIERWRAAGDRLRLVALERGTVADYAAAVEQILTSEPIDAAFLAMAVSDFEPEPSTGKLSSDADELMIRCRATPKVIRRVKDWSPSTYLVGFKLLSNVSEAALIEAAVRSNAANRADLTVANDLTLYRAGRHTIHLVRPRHSTETIAENPAARLVSRVAEWRPPASAP